jgi:hypothetical protein
MKTWNDLELILAIRTAVERYDLEEENRRLLALVKDRHANSGPWKKDFPHHRYRARRGRIHHPAEMSEEEMEQIRKQCG